MGLETVEMVMAAEEEFNISIPDESLEQTATVDDLFRLICTHIEMQKGGRMLNS